MKRKLIIILLSLLTANLTGFSRKYNVDRIILGSADKPGMTNTVRFEVRDAELELVYSVDVLVDYDLPYPSGYTFDDGSLAVVWSYDASADLFDRNGSLVKKHFMLGPDNIEYERSLMAAADGDNLVLVLSGPGLPHSMVQVFGSDLDLLNEWNSEYKNVTGIALDNEKEIIALSGYNFKNSMFEFSSSFLNSKGVRLGMVRSPFRKGQFDPAGFFTAHDNSSAFRVSTNSFQIIEEFKAGENEIVLDSYGSGDNLIIAVASKPGLVKDEWLYNGLRIVDMKNNTIQRERNVSPGLFRKAGFVSGVDGIKINIDGSLISTD